MSTSRKEKLLRILISGPIGHEDYPAAVQLIQSGYAVGPYTVSSTQAAGQIETLIWGGATINGMQFADTLADQIKKTTLRYQVGLVAKLVASYLAGVGTALAPEILKWLF